MPAVSKVQQKFMGAELSRKRAGKSTKTGMSAKQLGDFAGTKTGGLPERKKIGKGHWGKGDLKSAGGSCTEVPEANVVNTAYRSKMESLYKDGCDATPGVNKSKQGTVAGA